MDTLSLPPEKTIQHPIGNGVNHPLIARWIAQFISVVFHPLFIPVIVTWYLVYLQTGLFTGYSATEKQMVLIRVGYNTIFFPALTVVLLKAVGFLKNIYLKTQRERIIPYIATNIFYFWTYLVLKNHEGTPTVLTSFILGIFLAYSLALIANIYFKISMHGLGVGAFTGVMLLLIFTGFPFTIFLPAMVVFVLTGVVATSRLIVSNHTPFEIYTGILIGILCQLIGYFVVA